MDEGGSKSHKKSDASLDVVSEQERAQQPMPQTKFRLDMVQKDGNAQNNKKVV